MYKQVEISIKGVAPLLLHNARKLTNPLDPLTKQIKVFSKKRSKTEDDLLALSKLEWLGGFYLTEEPQIEVVGSKITVKNTGLPCIPGEAIEATLVGGAKKNKLGTTFKAGLMVLDNSILKYEGSKNLEEMWAAGTFTDVRNVRIQRAAIMRTRPIFYQWGLDFTVHYLPSVVNVEQIHEAVTVAGMIVGLCDYRPKYGRFEAV